MAEHRVTFSSTFSIERQELFEWHARPGAFTRLTPPWQRLRELAAAGGIQDGAWREIELRLGPLPVRWTAEHEKYVSGRQFVDRQAGGPFASWLHRHSFDSVAGGSQLTDQVSYRLPLEIVSDRLANRAVRRTLVRTFRFRHQRTRMDLAHHAGWRDQPRLHVYIGPPGDHMQRQLAAFFSTAGHTVSPLFGGCVSAAPAVVIWREPGNAHGELLRAIERHQAATVVVLTDNAGAVQRLLKLAPPGTRFVVLLHGPVLSAACGFLPSMVRGARLGLLVHDRIDRWIQLDDLLAATLHAVHDDRAHGGWAVCGQHPAPAVDVTAALDDEVSPRLPFSLPARTGSPRAALVPTPVDLPPFSELGNPPWFRRFDDALRFELGRLERLPNKPFEWA